MSRDEYKENRSDNAHATPLNSGMYKRWMLLEIKVSWLRLRVAWKTGLVWVLTRIVTSSLIDKIAKKG